jgi:hypothetical protein
MNIDWGVDEITGRVINVSFASHSAEEELLLTKMVDVFRHAHPHNKLILCEGEYNRIWYPHRKRKRK